MGGLLLISYPDFRFQISDLLPTAHCPLSTAHYPLPTTHYPLPTYDTLWLGINPPQPILFAKIKKRLKQRLGAGMAKEVRDLHQQLPLAPSLKKRGGTLFLPLKISKNLNLIPGCRAASEMPGFHKTFVMVHL